MERQSLVAGVGALAFGVLTLVAFMVANPPGGTYSASDIADFLAKGHRAAVFVSVYIMLVALAGLLLALARLRDRIEGARASTFWAFAVCAVTALMVGYVLAVSPALALAFSGGKLTTLDPSLAYTLGETGWGVMYGGGGLLLGCGLLTFAGGRVAVPAWVRWFTAVAGVAALAAVAWFPFFLVYAWAIVLGLWTLVAGRRRAPEAAPVRAA